jgi:integrase
MKLTQRAIEVLTCPPDKKDKLVFDDVRTGLAVRVTAAGSKSYLCQYTFGGQKRRVPLGNCSALSLAAARKAVQAIIGDVAKGLDPAAERKDQFAAARAKKSRDDLSLGVLMQSWEQLHLAHRRPRYAAEAIRALSVAFAPHLHLPAVELDRTIVVKVIDGLSRRGHVALAARTAAYGKACFGWALKRGSVNSNPFVALPLVPVQARDHVLTDVELAAIWRAVAEMGGVYGLIVRFLALTGQRRDEVAGMQWDEVDLGDATWTIPKARAKSGTTHVVPLSRPAQELLGSLLRANDFVFSGGGGPFSGWSKAKSRLDLAAGVTGWRLHDLRRTLATGLQRLGVRLEVTEAVLNHVSGSRGGIVGVYQRHDWALEKRVALEAWGEQLMAMVKGRCEDGNVVRLADRTPR